MRLAKEEFYGGERWPIAAVTEGCGILNESGLFVPVSIIDGSRRWLRLERHNTPFVFSDFTNMQVRGIVVKIDPVTVGRI